MSTPHKATVYEWIISGQGISSAPVDPVGNAIPIVRDLMFDYATGTFVMSGGNAVLTSGLEAARQEVRIKLLTFLGEWFLDASLGVPYFQSIFVKAPNLVVIKAVLTDKIEEVEEINSVTSMTLDFDRAHRTLKVTWVAESIYGIIQDVTPFSL